MWDVIAVIAGLWFSMLLIWIIKAVLDEPAEYQEDRDICDGCKWGWCMCIPGDKECQKHREERDEKDT